MSRVTNMTTGNPTKLILTFAIPLILTNLGQQFYMIADAAIVGRGVGVKALAAVGASDWTYCMFVWSIMGLAQGFSTFISRAFGEKDYRKLNKVFAMSVILCIAIAVFFTAVGLMVAKPLLMLLKTPADILHDSVVYITTMLSGLIFVMAYNMSAAILRAFGDGKSPLVAMLIAGLTNIGLDLFFVFVCRFGILGAALASIISQAISFVYCVFIIRKIEYIRPEKSDWKPDFSMLFSLLKFGAPLAMQHILIAASGIVLQSAVNPQGSFFVAGYTATNKLYGLLECSAISLGLSFSTYYAQNYGAGNKERMLSGFKSAMKLSLITAVIVMAVMLLLGKFMLLLFINSAEAGTSEALAVGYRYLVTMSFFMIILYVIHIYRNSLVATGDSFSPMMSGFLEFIFRVFCATVLIRMLGIDVLYYTEPISWIGALIPCVPPYYKFKRKYLLS